MRTVGNDQVLIELVIVDNVRLLVNDLGQKWFISVITGCLPWIGLDLLLHGCCRHLAENDHPFLILMVYHSGHDTHVGAQPTRT